MSIQKSFHNDHNSLLREIQQECYPDLAGALFETARDRYLLAVKLIGIDLVMAEVVRGLRRRDYRPLEEAYDIMAAYFRYKRPDANQLPLFASETIYKDEPLADKWIRYYFNEVSRLIEVDEDLCRNVLVAGMYSGRDSGNNAAALVTNRLAEMYVIADWAYPTVQKMYYIE